jgi:Protein of unknown function (DUF3833)
MRAMILLLALTACVHSVPPESLTAAAPEFRPELYFSGTATGHGVLQTGGGKPARAVRVESRGAALADGRFRLDQDIFYGDGKTARRFWIITRLDGGRYSATLSDAAGPVTAEVRGNLFHLRYMMKKPFVTMEQWMWLQPDGRTVMNEGIIRMPGRLIARLSEVIVRAGEPLK